MNKKIITLWLVLGFVFLVTQTVFAASTANVVINGTVEETISLARSGDGDITFGTMSYGDEYFATDSGTTTEAVGHTLTVDTNDTAGYSVSYTAAAFTAGSDTFTAFSSEAKPYTGSSEGWGLSAVVTSGANASIVAAYDSKYTFHSSDTVFSGTSETNGDIISITYMAFADSSTISGDYSTTITYTATTAT